MRSGNAQRLMLQAQRLMARAPLYRAALCAFLVLAATAVWATSRGLVAPANIYDGRSFDVSFDFIEHQLCIVTSAGRREGFALEPMTVAGFYAQFMQRLRRLGIDVRIWTMPGEIENAVPFEQDRVHAQYDPAYARKFWRALVHANRVMNMFRARYIGKASPVHFFWGSFDLAVTRFSGRTAPPPKGGTPHVANWVMAEAYSHEVSAEPAGSLFSS